MLLFSGCLAGWEGVSTETRKLSGRATAWTLQSVESDQLGLPCAKGAAGGRGGSEMEPVLRRRCWRWEQQPGAVSPPAAGPPPSRVGAWTAPLLAWSWVSPPEPRAVIGNRHLRILLPLVNDSVVDR